MYNRYYLPLEKGVALDLNPNYPRIFLLSLVEIGQVIVKNEIFKRSSTYFLYFAIISPWKRTWPLFERLNPHRSKMALYQIWLKLPQWLWSRRLSYSDNVFHLIKPESLSPKDFFPVVLSA